jgi:hypothetical protein
VRVRVCVCACVCGSLTKPTHCSLFLVFLWLESLFALLTTGLTLASLPNAADSATLSDFVFENLWLMLALTQGTCHVHTHTRASLALPN